MLGAGHLFQLDTSDIVLFDGIREDSHDETISIDSEIKLFHRIDHRPHYLQQLRHALPAQVHTYDGVVSLDEQNVRVEGT